LKTTAIAAIKKRPALLRVTKELTNKKKEGQHWNNTKGEKVLGKTQKEAGPRKSRTRGHTLRRATLFDTGRSGTLAWRRKWLKQRQDEIGLRQTKEEKI